jgi:hypothetical protein
VVLAFVESGSRHLGAGIVSLPQFSRLRLNGVLRSSSEALKITHLDDAPGSLCLLAWRVIQTLGRARRPALYV